MRTWSKALKIWKSGGKWLIEDREYTTGRRHRIDSNSSEWLQLEDEPESSLKKNRLAGFQTDQHSPNTIAFIAKPKPNKTIFGMTRTGREYRNDNPATRIVESQATLNPTYQNMLICSHALYHAASDALEKMFENLSSSIEPPSDRCLKLKTKRNILFECRKIHPSIWGGSRRNERCWIDRRGVVVEDSGRVPTIRRMANLEDCGFEPENRAKELKIFWIPGIAI